jgi:hypothetical protein
MSKRYSATAAERSKNRQIAIGFVPVSIETKQLGQNHPKISAQSTTNVFGPSAIADETAVRMAMLYSGTPALQFESIQWGGRCHILIRMMWTPREL